MPLRPAFPIRNFNTRNDGSLELSLVQTPVSTLSDRRKFQDCHAFRKQLAQAKPEEVVRWPSDP